MNSYSRAPIKEAILDIHVSGGRSSSLEIDDELGVIRESYPIRQEIFGDPKFEFSMVAGANPMFSAGPTLAGFRYLSGDSKQRFHARVEAFSFNRLAPYDKWETFSAEAQRLWNIYVLARRPQFITRIGLRYINHFIVPPPQEEGVEAVSLSHYFKVFPAWTSPYFETVDGFNLQIAAPQADLGATLLLSQSTVVDLELDQPAFVLDIDLFKAGIRQEVSDSKWLWNFVEKLRTRKNEVFESCLQDPVRELIR